MGSNVLHILCILVLSSHYILLLCRWLYQQTHVTRRKWFLLIMASLQCKYWSLDKKNHTIKAICSYYKPWKPEGFFIYFFYYFIDASSKIYGGKCETVKKILKNQRTKVLIQLCLNIKDAKERLFKFIFSSLMSETAGTVLSSNIFSSLKLFKLWKQAGCFNLFYVVNFYSVCQM